MLPDYNLDTESFKEMMDEARHKIASLYPEWTDYNFHDPGITMIELFAFIKEAQEYYLNQIGDEHKLKFLKMLGIKRKCKKPAQAIVSLIVDDDYHLFKGTKMLAGSVIFESYQNKYLTKNDVEFCFYASDQIHEFYKREQHKGTQSIRMNMLGNNPTPNDMFYIGFRDKLPANTDLQLYLGIANDPMNLRNIISHFDFKPLASLSFEYFTKNGWKTIEELEDQTYGLVQSGFIHFRMNEMMIETECFNEKGYYLRVSVIKSDYDCPPILENLSLNDLQVWQIDTLIEKTERSWIDIVNNHFQIEFSTSLAYFGNSEVYLKSQGLYYELNTFEKYLDEAKACSRIMLDINNIDIDTIDALLVVNSRSDFHKAIIGIANGLPEQCFELEDEWIEYESFEIIVEETLIKNAYSQWTKVDDFAQSGPADKHYVLDTVKGSICFGNCYQGMPPEGRIIIIGYARTVGENGNVSAFKINQIFGDEQHQFKVFNQKMATGGINEESLQDCYVRAKKRISETHTAVTYSDYEKRVKETPGLAISCCKVINHQENVSIESEGLDNQIQMVIKPFSNKKVTKLSQAYTENIMKYIEDFRTLGSQIILSAPVYISFEVYLYVKIKPHYRDTEKNIRKAIDTYFNKYEDQFGSTVYYGDFYGYLESLPYVADINTMNIEAYGNGLKRDKSGNIRCPANGVIELGRVDYMYNIGD